MLPRITFLNDFTQLSKSSYFLLIVYCSILICLTKLATAEKVVNINECKCRLENGGIIDLSSLDYKDKPRWKNLKATIRPDNYTYSFNPCSKFDSANKATGCKDVNVCQCSVNGTCFNCGSEAFFSWNDKTKSVHLLYTGYDHRGMRRITNISLVCSPETTSPVLEVIGEEIQKTVYDMILRSRCACPDLCREDHLSTGSILVILFLIFVSLYLVLGIIHSSLTRGAHGWELIPHHEFWADFPLLVRDGCVFVMSGCKADTAYERI